MDRIMGEERSGGEPHVVAVPYPGRGHINPMINLCTLLSSRSDAVLFTLVLTEEWLGLLASDLKPLESKSNVSLCSIPNVVPSEKDRAADIPGFVEAVNTKMEAPFVSLLARLQPPPTSILSDTNLSWALKAANQRNIPAAALWTMSASVFSLLHHFDLLLKNNHSSLDVSERGNEVVDYIPGLPSMRVADIPALLYAKQSHPTRQRILEFFTWKFKPQILLFTTIYELEAVAIEAIKSSLPIIALTIGPPIPYFKTYPALHQLEDDEDDGNDNKHLKWLDAQPRRSVIYVSLGSFLSASPAQMEELAAGLSSSGVAYLWVARGEGAPPVSSSCRGSDADSDEARGLVVRWCDQLRVLCHPAIGGFWTHCGWNSTLEGVFAGVPMLTFPMIADQVSNSRMVVDDWKVGWRVRGDGVGIDDLVPRDRIAQLVRRLMDSQDTEVLEMKARATAMGKVCRQAVVQGGSTETNLSSVHTFISTVGPLPSPC